MEYSQVNNQIENSKPEHKRGFLLWAIFSSICGIIFGWFISEIHDSNLSLLQSYRPSEPTILYDIKGRPFAELFIHKFELTPLERIPPSVIQTFVVVEDANFYHHFGFDISGIIRAAIKNIIAGKIVQGGSTLTQQVSKMLYLNVYKKREKSFIQKFKELILALKLEQNLSKDEILELYLNMVYFGHGCEGLTCASKLYFNKEVEDLTITEAALLARLPKSPVEYSPFKHPENAKQQHQFVLNRLTKSGILSQKEAERIHKDFWDYYWGYFITRSPATNIRAKRMDLAPYFTNYIETILKKHPLVGEERLYTGGLRIYTTLDLVLQLISQKEMTKTLNKADRIGRIHALAGGKIGVDFSLFRIHSLFSRILPIGRPRISGPTASQYFKMYIENRLLDGAQLLTLFYPAENENNAFEEVRKRTLEFSHNLHVEGALLSINHTTGGIRAMIGGRNFSPTNQYNRALFARRQPGSAFKIFVYGAALENRYINSMTPLSDAPIQIISDDGSVWSPGNYEGDFHGMVPATLALAYSLNTCSVDLYNRIGPYPIIQFAKKLMKISNPYRLRPDPALSLGASEITPRELAIATAIIANGGKDIIPYGIRYVIDKNENVIYSQEEIVKYNIAQKVKNGEIQVISPGTAFILRKMMQTAVNRGTLRHGIRDYREGNFYGDLAGKTGTTSSWSDAWVTAFNPELTFTLWFGFDRSSITLGPGQAGGTVAAPTLGKILRKYYQTIQKKPPSFSRKIPGDVIPMNCGYLLKPIVINHKLRRSPYRHICSIQNRIKDQRELIMEELGITPEELGIKNKRNIKFKNE